MIYKPQYPDIFEGWVSHDLNKRSADLYLNLNPEDRLLIWQFIEQNYLTQYKQIIGVRFEWCATGLWGINFPGSTGYGTSLMHEDFEMPTSLTDEIMAWHDDRDANAEPWEDEDLFDYQASDIKGLAAAKSVKAFLGDDYYVEYKKLQELKVIDGEVVETPIPSFIITIADWDTMVNAVLSGDFDTVSKLVGLGFDLNLIHPRKKTRILCAYVDGLHDDLSGKSYRHQMLSHLISLGAKANISNTNDIEPLWMAVIYFDTKMIEILLKAGANPNIDDDGKSLYDWAKFDYWFEEYSEKGRSYPLPPSERPRQSEENWLDYLDEMAVLSGASKPEHLRLLRQFGAKTTNELTESEN